MNKYKIIGDSCCDLFADKYISDKVDFATTPLTITIGNRDFVDDDSLDLKEMLTAMNSSKTVGKTACPSPESYMSEMEDWDNIFVVTLSSKLSGSYNSALLAAKTTLQKYPNKKIFVVDSLSASSGMTLIIDKLRELIESEQYSFEEIVTKITAFRNSTRVRFILHDLGNLTKAGRMSKVVGLVVSVLNIKPILGDDGNGEIKICSKVIGSKKALSAICNFPGDKIKINGHDTPIIISHCNNEEEANFLKNILTTELGFTNVKVNTMRGLSSFYANEKGLILAYLG